jgi:uncharacterized protein YbaP (TraB family)
VLQNCIIKLSQMLQNCEDVCNFLDDKVIYRRLQSEHDARLDKVMQTFREKGHTVNRKKVCWVWKKIDFFG